MKTIAETQAETVAGPARGAICLVSAPVGVNLQALWTQLESAGMTPRLTSDWFPPGGSATDGLTAALAKARLFIGVLDLERPNANVYFELGYARSMGIDILVLAHPDLQEIPPHVSLLPMLHVTPDGSAAIPPFLELLWRESTHPQSDGARVETPAHPLGTIAEDFIRQLNELGPHPAEATVQTLVEDALRASGLIVVSEPRAGGYRPDFAIWSGDFPPWIPNPLFVELKVCLRDRRDLVESIIYAKNFAHTTRTPAVLLLYLESKVPMSAQFAMGDSTVLFADIRDLLEALRSSTFSQFVLRVRNEQAHGVAS